MINYTDQTMEKNWSFFPTFSIFHALGSILTTGGVLGSWTLVKLLSSPLEEANGSGPPTNTREVMMEEGRSSADW